MEPEKPRVVVCFCSEGVFAFASSPCLVQTGSIWFRLSDFFHCPAFDVDSPLSASELKMDRC